MDAVQILNRALLLLQWPSQINPTCAPFSFSGKSVKYDHMLTLNLYFLQGDIEAFIAKIL